MTLLWIDDRLPPRCDIGALFKLLFKLFILLIVIAAIAGGVYFFLLRGEEEELEPTLEAIAAGELFPEKANLIASIDIAAILSDPDMQSLYQQKAPAGWPPTLNGALTWIQARTFVDPRDFELVTLFGDVDTFVPGPTYVGFLLSGTFTEEGLTPVLQGIPGVRTDDYKGKTLYQFQPGPRARQLSIAFLDDGALVAGTTDAVEDVIDVVVRDAPGLSPEHPVYEAYHRLGSQFKIALKVPQRARVDGPELLRGTDTLGLSIAKSGQRINIEALAHFPFAAAAQQAQAGIGGGIQQLMQGIQASDMPAQGKTLLSALLHRVALNVSDSWVRALLTVSPAELQGLIDLIQSMEHPPMLLRPPPVPEGF